MKILHTPVITDNALMALAGGMDSVSFFNQLQYRKGLMIQFMNSKRGGYALEPD